MNAEEEINGLEALKDKWIKSNPDEIHITDTISDIRDFQENLKTNFPIVSKFYWRNMQLADTFFQDAHDDLWSYLENKEAESLMFSNAMEHLENGLNHLIKKLKEIK